jgi:hypothetical protein
MSETIDFSSASANDFNVGAQEVSQPEVQAEPQVETQVQSQVEPQVETKTETPEPVAEEATVKESLTAREYNFKDDFIKGVVEFYEKTGDLAPYLQAKTVDFTNMPDEEILRRNLREEYQDLSDKAFERLYKQQVTDKFKLDADEWGEEDSELGRELLKVEASKLRNQYLDWQKNFAAPEPQPYYDQTAEMLQKFETEVKNSEFTKGFLGSKTLTIKTSDGEFNYEVPQADAVIDMTIDNDRFFSQFAGDQGQLDYAKWYKTVAYSQNPELFERSLINYGKTLGRSEVTKEIKNPITSPVGDVPTEGNGDFKTGLLQAFAMRGITK